MDEPVRREEMEMQTQRVNLWTQLGEDRVGTAGEGESGMNGESSINIYTLSCVK